MSSPRASLAPDAAHAFPQWTPGGEVAFVSRMIQESAHGAAGSEPATAVPLRHAALWFTSMVGKKASLGPLVDAALAAGASEVHTATFAQGRTWRWGIAWTFHAAAPESWIDDGWSWMLRRGGAGVSGAVGVAAGDDEELGRGSGSDPAGAATADADDADAWIGDGAGRDDGGAATSDEVVAAPSQLSGSKRKAADGGAAAEDRPAKRRRGDEAGPATAAAPVAASASHARSQLLNPRRRDVGTDRHCLRTFVVAAGWPCRASTAPRPAIAQRAVAISSSAAMTLAPPPWTGGATQPVPIAEPTAAEVARQSAVECADLSSLAASRIAAFLGELTPASVGADGSTRSGCTWAPASEVLAPLRPPDEGVAVAAFSVTMTEAGGGASASGDEATSSAAAGFMCEIVVSALPAAGMSSAAAAGESGSDEAAAVLIDAAFLAGEHAAWWRWCDQVLAAVTQMGRRYRRARARAAGGTAS